MRRLIFNFFKEKNLFIDERKRQFYLFNAFFVICAIQFSPLLILSIVKKNPLYLYSSLFFYATLLIYLLLIYVKQREAGYHLLFSSLLLSTLFCFLFCLPRYLESGFFYLATLLLSSILWSKVYFVAIYGGFSILFFILTLVFRFSPEVTTLSSPFIRGMIIFIFLLNASFLLLIYSMQEWIDRCQKETLKEQAHFDPLTELGNRSYFLCKAKKEFSLALEGQRQMTLLLLDLDHFKAINDRWGHRVGDLVLIQIGKVLRSHFRVDDPIGRFGGEEFVVLLKGAQLRQVEQSVDSLRKKIEQINFKEFPNLRVSASIGLVEYRPEDQTILDLIDRADKAMYRAKKRGRNQVVIER